MKLAKPLLVAAAVLAIAGALVYALMEKPAAPASTFTTLEGKTLSLDQHDLIQTYNQYKDRGFVIVAVAMSYDPPNYVANFAKTRQLPFPVALDVNGEHAHAFGDVQVTPTSFLIGKDGRIIEQKLGDVDFNQRKALLDKELT